MSAEAINAAATVTQLAAQAVRSASVIARAKDIASAHPLGAVAVGVVVGGCALFGGYKLMQKAFSPKAQPVQLVASPAAPVAPVAPAPVQ